MIYDGPRRVSITECFSHVQSYEPWFSILHDHTNRTKFWIRKD